MPPLRRARALGLALVSLALPAHGALADTGAPAASPGGGVPPMWTLALDLGDGWFHDAELAAGDLDGDGLDDLVIANPDEGLDVEAEGTVRVYLGASGLLSGEPDRIWAGGEPGADLGGSLLILDLDGDGLDDVVAGAPRSEGATVDEGVLHLYYGHPIDLPVEADALWLSTFGQGKRVGTALAEGDVDGDGDPELLVASPMAGGVAAFEGPHPPPASPTVNTPVPTFVLSSGGLAVQGNRLDAGDTNGDGFDEVVVDGPYLGGAQVTLWQGAPDPASVPPEAAYTRVDGGNFSVGRIGALLLEDLDADGFADLALGLPHSEYYSVDTGASTPHDAVAVVLGGGGGLDPDTTAFIPDGGPWGGFGSALALGDLTGDGQADLVVGNPMSPREVPSLQGVLLFRGQPHGVAAAAAHVWLGDATPKALAEALAVGDFDGDGALDLASTARRPTDPPHLSSGAVHVLLAAPPPPTLSRSFLRGSTIGEALGAAIATGDVNGDGIDDVVIGTPRASVDHPAEGRLCVHLGTPAGPQSAPRNCWEGGAASTCLGAAVAVVDLDGDSVHDVAGLSGGCFDDGTRPTIAAAHAWFGGPGAPEHAPDWTYETGAKVHAVTPLHPSSDGHARLALGSPFTNQGGWLFNDYWIPQTGNALVVPRDILEAPEEPLRSIPHGGAYLEGHSIATWGHDERFGEVLTAGDFDGDGLDELVSRLRVHEDRGGVRIVPPTERPDPSTYRRRVAGDAPWVELGRVIAAGDVDGDGLDDLVVGSPDFPHPTEARGRIAVHYGTPRGPSAEPGVVWPGDAPGVHLGAVLTVVDLDHDGRAEIVAGRPGDPQAGLAVYTLRPRAAHVSDWMRRTLEDLAAYRAGLTPHPLVTERWRGLAGVAPRTLATGDVNGDGWTDLLVGHEGAHAGWGEGAVELRYGSAAGFVLTPPPVVDGDGDGVAQLADCDDADPGAGRPRLLHPDADLDGYGARYGGAWLCSHPTWIPDTTDCDDLDPLSFPGAPETCDGVDQDCSGVPDDEPTLPDVDADGVCDAMDRCPLDPVLPDDDLDNDRICNHDDVCTGYDPTGDPDGDGLCTDRDLCFGDNSTGDEDEDGLCDGLDFVLTVPTLTLGRRATLTVLRAPPGSTVTWYVTAEGYGREEQPCEDPAVPCLLLTNPSVLGQRVANAAGTATLDLTMPSTMTDRKIHLQAASFDGTISDVTPVVHRTVQWP